MECKGVERCDSLTILADVHMQYQQWMKKKNDPITNNQFAQPQIIINHFNHLIISHSDDKDFNAIYNAFGGNDCNVNDCVMFKRHYRDKNKYKESNPTIKLYNITINRKNENTKVCHM